MTQKPPAPSDRWRAQQLKLGKKIFDKKGRGWNLVATLDYTSMGKFINVPFSPIARNKKSFKSAQLALQALARSEGAMFIRICTEPTLTPLEHRNFGFRPIKPLAKPKKSSSRRFKPVIGIWEFPIDATRYRFFYISREINRLVKRFARK